MKRYPGPPPEPKTSEPVRRRTFVLTNRDDLAYLEAMADMAPLLSSRSNMSDPLTSFWASVVKGLIGVIREMSDASEAG